MTLRIHNDGEELRVFAIEGIGLSLNDCFPKWE